MIVKIQLDEDLKKPVDHYALVMDKEKSIYKKTPVTQKLLLEMGKATLSQPKGKGDVAFFDATINERGEMVIHHLASWQEEW